MPDQSNFWQQDTFGIQREHTPAPHVKKVHDIPDTRELFTIQRQLLRAIHAMDEKTDRQVRENVERAYKSTRRYLDKYVAPSGPGGL